jgi:hypothetical protein
MKVRQSVWVTWSARRRSSAAWPAWVADGVLEDGAPRFRAESHVVAQVATAISGRMAVTGAVFGCGVMLDVEGLEQEAACEVVSLGLLGVPGTQEDSGEVTARIELDAEVEYGPNSFELGRELAHRLGPAEWTYAAGAVAELHVDRVEVDAGEAGRVAIYPARGWLL